MTRLTPRLRWRQAVASDRFPRTERVVKGTLLALAELMASTGELHEWRDSIAEATGLPVRTLNRHLERAVSLGWLMREVPGGNGRKSLYRAVIPGEGCAPEVAHNFQSCGPSTRIQLPEVVGHLVAHSIKTEHSRQRVPGTRRPTRQTNHSGHGRDEREHDGTSQAGSNGSGQPTPSKRLSLVPRTEVA